MTIGFIGNPNCGKTTLFNAYTGANLKVANWPGVTVEKVEGAIKDHDLNIRLVDLPGTYSLTSYTMEEQVSRQFILSDEVDVIIDVADASALERNLYLTLQLLELGKPVVLALNMMDIVEKRGMEIDTHRLPEMLGIPVIPVSARKRTGLDVLLHAAAHHKDCKDPECLIHHHKYTPKHRHDHHSECVLPDDFLPALRSLCSGPSYNSQGIRQYKVDAVLGPVPVGCGLGCYFCGLSCWTFAVRYEYDVWKSASFSGHFISGRIWTLDFEKRIGDPKLISCEFPVRKEF